MTLWRSLAYTKEVVAGSSGPAEGVVGDGVGHIEPFVALPIRGLVLAYDNVGVAGA